MYFTYELSCTMMEEKRLHTTFSIKEELQWQKAIYTIAANHSS